LLAAADAFFAASAASTSTGHCSDSTTVAVDTMAPPSNASNNIQCRQNFFLEELCAQRFCLGRESKKYNERQNDYL
jgi:hypothetical protein